MSLTHQEAYTALGLPYAPDTEIKSAYKKLALEWHSDKNHHNSDTATIRFQQATGAYQLLAAEKKEAQMSLDDILDLLNMMFFGAMGGFPFHRRRFVYSNGDRDKFYISDDGNMDDLFNPSGGFHEPSANPCQSSREPYHRTHAASSNTSTAHKTPSLLAPVTVAKSASKGGILKPLATGEIVKKKRKVLDLSDSDSSDVMDFMVDEELLESVTCVMPSKRTEKAVPRFKIQKVAGKKRSVVVLTKAAIEITRQNILAEKIKQEKMVSALPSIELPEKQQCSPFAWFEGPDDDTTSE